MKMNKLPISVFWRGLGLPSYVRKSRKSEALLATNLLNFNLFLGQEA